MPFPLSSPRILAALAAFTLPGWGSSAAEISGGGAEAGTLKPANRVEAPIYAPASDEAIKLAKGFQLPAGFTTNLWASEPMLANPVSISIDEQGRIFVAETFRLRTSNLDIRHYMFMLEDDLASRTTDDRIAFTKKSFPNDWQKMEIESERIQLLQDTDGDGKADKSTIYAEDMHTLLDGCNSGVLAYNGKVWCTNIPNLWQFSGLTKDGKAEKRELVSTGYGVRYSFTGHDLHGLVIGPDGRLYFSFGDRGAYVKTKEGKTLAFSDEGGVFRCELDGSHLEAVYRGLRNPQELAFDNHGNLFTGDNDCDQGDRERWVYLLEGGDSGWRVGWQHPPLGVAHNMWMTEHLWEPRQASTAAYILSPIMNIPDGPSGVAHYPGTGFPAEYDDMFFVCGYKGTSARSAISSWKVREESAGFVVEKTPAPFVDHVQSTDLEFGPDSRLYFTDWGEGWEGTGRGRIFRLENAEVRKAQAAQIAEVQKLLGDNFVQRPSGDLLKLLAHGDQRIRLRAQWALAARISARIIEKNGNIAAVPEWNQLREAALHGVDGAEKALSRLHAIWAKGHIGRAMADKAAQTPGGTTSVALDDLSTKLLADPDAEIRAQSWKVLGDLTSTWEPEVIRAATSALADTSRRVRCFAALALAKRGDASAAPAILTMLRENADQDQYLRHAGVMALAGIHDASTLATAAKDESRSVRLTALIAMRRLEMPEVAQFLKDSDPALVLEAARAINDAGIAGAYGELAKLVSKPIKDEQLMLRVLNANFRLGTVEAALALMKYVIDVQQPEFLRIEGLNLLGLWINPPQRDRVAGVFRPLSSRAGFPVEVFRGMLLGTLPTLFQAKSEDVALAAMHVVQALEMKETGSSLLDLMAQKQVSPKVRAEALKTLGAFNDPKLKDAIKLAVADKNPGLRVEASAMLGKLDPSEAAKQLGAAFTDAALEEKKQIISALGDLPGAAADQALAGLLGDAAKIPAEAKLELIEAAEKRKAADVKAKLGAYLGAAPANDPLGKFDFAMAGGDAANGERLFREHVAAQCLRCHKVQGTGGDAGPDLSKVAAKKDRRYLLESIINPSAQIAEGFQTIMVTLTNGDIKAGIVKAETADTITLQMPVPDAPAETVKKADIKTRENAPSGMPPGLGDMLSKRDLRDIVEYLTGLRD
jgi:quinoprotein glucose dehydrogenase